MASSRGDIGGGTGGDPYPNRNDSNWSAHSQSDSQNETRDITEPLILQSNTPPGRGKNSKYSEVSPSKLKTSPPQDNQANGSKAQQIDFSPEAGKRISKTDVVTLDESAFKNKGSKENESLNKIR